MPTSKDFTYTRALLNFFRDIMKYSKKIDWTWFDCVNENYLENSSNLKQGAHIHQPKAGPVPDACAQPYHAGRGSHGQLFCPYCGSSAWHSRRSVTGENPCIKDPFLPRWVLSVPAPHNTCGSCWQGTARQFSHDMRGEGRSWVWCMCAPCFNLSFENSKLNCSTA